MANLLLTLTCVRSCPYCFAKKEISHNKGSEFINWENIVYVANFLKRTNESNISLLGGEPTLHPDFIDIVLYLISRDFSVNVFTSGIVSEERLNELSASLKDLPRNQLNFVCNLNNPEQTETKNKNETKKVRHFLELMGPLVTPGFNIYRSDFDIAFLFDLICGFGLKKHIRFGIASPIPDSSNLHIEPVDTKSIINRLYSFRESFETFHIEPGFDCGFTLCAFTEEQLGFFFKMNRDIFFNCGPAFDITPDLDLFSCFPLSRFHRKSLYEFNSTKEIVEYYLDIHNCVRQEIPGIYKECDGCYYQENGRCSGGGLCQILGRFFQEEPVRLKVIEDALSKDRLAV
jgi:hypothetical protein